MSKNSMHPKCGSSDQRNLDYQKNYSAKVFFDNLISNSAPIIFDIGAHRGESIYFFKSLYDKSSIYSFEPEPNNYKILASVANDFKTHAFMLACGNRNLLTKFYRQDLSHLGGLLRINRMSSDSLGYARKSQNEVIYVNSIKLDTFCLNNQISKIDILKIDVQGFEVLCLQGALDILINTACVTVEISLYDFYENNNSSLLEVELIMKDAGFSLWDISKISKNPKNLRTDWIEAVYRKSNSFINK